MHYSFDGKEHFEETWTFPCSQVPKSLSSQVVQEASKALWLMCGISYYKAAIPQEIIIKDHEISEHQAAFFEKTYLNGLGEFFYLNQIKPSIPRFPCSRVHKSSSTQVGGLSGTLIPVGGGKDSLVTVEILKSLSSHGHTHDIFPLTTWNAGKYPFFDPMLKIIDLPHITPERKISPNLIRLNQEGALNGHVPISALWAFESVLTALFLGKKYIAFSNESSANEPTLFWDDLAINHQYSKTLEFEQDFQQYTRENITPDIQYFSFLRPLTELRIAEVFAQKCFKKYQHYFSSCNKNFRFTKAKNTSDRFIWCADCPKCAFIACIFAPFIPKADLIELFGGNPFEKESITQHFPELMGLVDTKPFDCVGEVAEVRQALLMAYQSGNYPELETWIGQIKWLSSSDLIGGSRKSKNLDSRAKPENENNTYDYKALRPHSMLEAFFEVLTSAMKG
ncbi:MAG TPA: hypothetical protein VIT68_00975 [Candidatus Gracilibacteria bacterium]